MKKLLKNIPCSTFCKLNNPKIIFYINPILLRIYLKVGFAKIKAKKTLLYFQDLNKMYLG